MEAFKSKDPTGSGYITPLDFQDIMLSVKNHLLTPEVKDNLVAVSWRTFFLLKHKPNPYTVLSSHLNVND